jgi:hypothetical protein
VAGSPAVVAEGLAKRHGSTVARHLRPDGAFNSSFTGVGIADDLSKGLIERLRSLPMYSAAVLIGRTIAGAVLNLITFAVMFGVALAVGFRVEGTALDAAWATLLLFGFSYAFSRSQAFIGLSVKTSRPPTRPGSSGCSR